MVTAIIIVLFIGHAIWLFSNIIAINKIAVRRLVPSERHFSKSEWLQIGKHILYMIAGVLVFLLLILLTYYWGYWRHNPDFKIYY